MNLWNHVGLEFSSLSFKEGKKLLLTKTHFPKCFETRETLQLLSSHSYVWNLSVWQLAYNSIIVMTGDLIGFQGVPAGLEWGAGPCQPPSSPQRRRNRKLLLSNRHLETCCHLTSNQQMLTEPTAKWSIAWTLLRTKRHQLGLMKRASEIFVQELDQDEKFLNFFI